MSIIKAENLTFSYPNGSENIFEDVNFQIDTDWKLGFVGRNGRGKTTFLRLLLGEYEYSGRIISSVGFVYFPFMIEDKCKLTLDILQEHCHKAEEWEFIRELSYLGMEADVLWREFGTLSPGEQTKALLAALFLNDDKFLLIDEPTNHLDSEARETVSAYLRNKKGFILVSHDRSFLDGCIDHILSLNRADIEVQSGNFSSWMMNFERRQEFEQAQNERLKKELGRLRVSARRSAGWADNVEATKTGAYDKGYVGHKSAKMMKRAKNIENRRIRAAEEKSELLKNTETAENLKLSPLLYHTDTIVSVSEVEVYYDGRAVCGPVSFVLHKDERIALIGKNGSGKSSILKLLCGHQIEHTGRIETASGLVISYVPQDTSRLRGMLSEFAYENHIDESLFKTILRKMDFERIQFEKNMADFSEGQKKKVLIAKSLCERAHLYVWDEPLNFIDIYSRMQIERLLKDFNGSMIFTEHDKSFRGAVATKCVEV